MHPSSSRILRGHVHQLIAADDIAAFMSMVLGCIRRADVLFRENAQRGNGRIVIPRVKFSDDTWSSKLPLIPCRVGEYPTGSILPSPKIPPGPRETETEISVEEMDLSPPPPPSRAASLAKFPPFPNLRSDALIVSTRFMGVFFSLNAMERFSRF